MSVSVRQPSNRLRRAAAAERAAVERDRERLQRKRDRLTAQVAELDDALRTAEERLAVLSTLARPPETATRAEATACEPPGDPARVLHGLAVRETAVRVLSSHRGRIEALHYRDWYQLVRQAGYAVAGSDPLAVFLTQLTRSPVICKSTQPGVYAVDREAPQRIRQRLERLARELREVTAAAPGPVELATVRVRRRQLDRAIGRQERALEEALWVLAATLRTHSPEGRDDTSGRQQLRRGRPGAGHGHRPRRSSRWIRGFDNRSGNLRSEPIQGFR